MKVLIIGLDGVPLDLIRRWAGQGQLPNLQRLMTEGATGHLQSTIPPTSGPSWSSFQTGKNPGKTGVYDFLYRCEGTYDFSPVNAAHRDGRTIWSLVNQAGYRVGVLNMPMTYPVEKTDGFMVSGFMTPYAAPDFIHPAELLRELQEEVGYYRIYPTETFSDGNQEGFLAASRELLAMRTQTALYLMDEHPVDLMAVVYFDTDRILHQLWHFLDVNHPWRNDTEDRSHLVMGYFRQLDASIGKLLERANEDTSVIVLSDHGMGPAHNFIVLNNWLLDEGLLRLKSGARTALREFLFRHGFTLRNVHKLVNRLGLAKHAEYKAGYFAEHLIKLVFLSFLDVDWSHSLAYSYGRHLGPIYINLKGREPQGIVQPGRDYEQVRDSIIERAKEFVDPRDDHPLIGHVAKREDIYAGPHLKDAPDLMLFPADERDIFFGLSDFGSNRTVDTVYRYPGMHRDQGLLIMYGPDIAEGVRLPNARIWDVAPTVLHQMDIPIPQDMDGQVLQGAFRGQGNPKRVVLSDKQAPSPATKPSVADGYSREAEKEIMERLKRLGYLG